MVPLEFSLSRVENLMQKVSFDPEKMTGEIITNTSVVMLEMLDATLRTLQDAIMSGLTVSPFVKIESAGNRARIWTACSITIDGMLLKAGIPVNYI